MRPQDRLAAIEAHLKEYESFLCPVPFDGLQGNIVVLGRVLRQIPEDWRWLIAEVRRWREVMDGGRTPKQMWERERVFLLAGLKPEEVTPAIVAYADSLIDELKAMGLSKGAD